MRRVAWNHLHPGMRLAYAVKDEGGQVLLTQGVVLEERSIERLDRKGVESVWIDDPRFEGLEFEAPISGDLLRAGRQLFAQWEQALGDGTPRPCADYRPVSRLISMLADAQNGSTAHPLTLLPVDGKRQPLVVLALNAAHLALAMAPRLDLGRYAADVAAGAFVRDVALLVLPPDQRWANPLDPSVPPALAAHPSDGLRCLAPPSWPPLSKIVITQHHERLDGSGYPEGLKGEKVHRAAALVAVIDVYTALLRGGPGGPACTPEQGLEYILSCAGSVLDTGAVQLLCHTIGLYAPGTLVRLSTGEEAVILDPGRGTFQRPKVRVLPDGHTLDLQTPEALSVQVSEIIEQ